MRLTAISQQTEIPIQVISAGAAVHSACVSTVNKLHIVDASEVPPDFCRYAYNGTTLSFY